jgi:hypothetical protein
VDDDVELTMPQIFWEVYDRRRSRWISVLFHRTRDEGRFMLPAVVDSDIVPGIA